MMGFSPPEYTGHAQNMKIPLYPPFACLWQGNDTKGEGTPSFRKGRNFPSLEKRGQGRFLQEYVSSIMGTLIIRPIFN